MEVISKIECAYEAYRREPNQKNADALKVLIGPHIQHRGIASVGPCVAMIVTMGERGQVCLHNWKMRAVLWVLTTLILRPWRVGWNDYYMTRWQLTKEQRWACEIHRRTHFGSPPKPGKTTDPFPTDNRWGQVGWTARWMANSQRSEDPEFDAALRQAEQHCGCLA